MLEMFLLRAIFLLFACCKEAWPFLLKTPVLHRSTATVHIDCSPSPPAGRVSYKFQMTEATRPDAKKQKTTTMGDSSTRQKNIADVEKESLPPLVIAPNAGRTYPMGRMTAIFKADNDETNSAMSVSEWWLEPNTEGPPKHKHPQTHLFYVIEGPMMFYLQDKGWFEAEKGSYVYIPGNTEHGFENRSMTNKAGFMSINTPGGFENDMPHIMDYVKTKPFGDALNES